MTTFHKMVTHRIHGAGIYANIWGILMGSMLPYIAAPWIRHGSWNGPVSFQSRVFPLQQPWLALSEAVASRGSDH